MSKNGGLYTRFRYMCATFDTFPPYKASQRHQFGLYFRRFVAVPRGRFFSDAAAPCLLYRAYFS